ncbi:phage tail family protein [Streptomyces sp. MBT56]|uniref:phage tail family protein n=1 Tax=unclassified Streptomyces TaxID=2593676 RepID=UPI00190A903A|nr:MULTISPECIES: phage tail family protein [unclassified Streptomyces]MBK3561083.1 phage tail family protein [Streptomyces sp. MBT56]MBK3602426.1 phage tail family protein [Streptomyces sp. MBT54]MBK3615485.1 phage tail family protein [Streptomyces sp. MBT98]
MPLITAPVIPPDPGDPGGPEVPGGGGTPIPLPGVGNATAFYTDPAGTVWPLSESAAGWFTLAAGVSGLGAAAYTLTSDAQPRGGARLRHAQPQPRTIIWPLYVYGDTHLQYLERWRQLATAFTRTLRRGRDGRRTPGTLTIVRPDGTSRSVKVFYSAGFEGQGKAGSGIISDAVALALWCEDPYWTDGEAVTVHRENGALVDFLDPYPSVSSSQVLGETVVDNPGDAVVWPTWTITGPASLITFTNEDTGDSFALDPAAVGHGALAAGEQVTVRTDPGQVRFQDGSPDGVNWAGALDWPEAVLWGLEPGENLVTFQLDGSGPGSAVDLTFHARHETA